MSASVEHDGHAVPCSSETQTKEQTYPNDLKPGAEGAPPGFHGAALILPIHRKNTSFSN